MLYSEDEDLHRDFKNPDLSLSAPRLDLSKPFHVALLGHCKTCGFEKTGARKTRRVTYSAAPRRPRCVVVPFAGASNRSGGKTSVGLVRSHAV